MRARFNSSLIFFLMIIMSCSESSDPRRFGNTNYIFPEGGKLTIGSRINLTFPPGAVTEPTQILLKEEMKREASGALITPDESVIFPEEYGLELWPQDLQFQAPISVDYYGENWYQSTPGKDAKYFYNWKPVATTSSGFTTNAFSKFLPTSAPSKDVFAFTGLLFNTDLYRQSRRYNILNTDLRGYKAIYEPAQTRYTAVVTLHVDIYSVFLFFEENPVGNKTYTVADAYTNGYGRATTSQIELGFSSGCWEPDPCDYYYRSTSGQVKYFIQGGVHKVLFKNVSFTDPATKEKMQIDGYVILK